MRLAGAGISLSDRWYILSVTHLKVLFRPGSSNHIKIRQLLLATHLFEKEYWSRAWAMQEIALARDLEVLWAAAAIDDASLQRIVNFEKTVLTVLPAERRDAPHA